MRRPIDPRLALRIAGALCLAVAPLLAQTANSVLEGRAAFGDWRADRPGMRRLIKPRDLPPPQPKESVANMVRVVQRTDQMPVVPPGFAVDLFASGLAGPRMIRAAPNGDIFVAESRAGRISVLRPDRSAKGVAAKKADKKSIFASGLRYPFGIAFYPPGADPQWVYIADTGAVLRFPYRSGDLSPRGEPETVVAQLPVGGHATRDVAFSPDGATMYVSVGSRSNDGEGMSRLSGASLQSFIADHPLGAAWGYETDRANVLAFDPQGKDKKSSPPASAIASAWRSRPTARCGARPMSATISATTCRPITSRACAKAPSSAGRGTTSAAMKIRITAARAPTSKTR
jgi:glucose/arabinose dehydrogenase